VPLFIAIASLAHLEQMFNGFKAKNFLHAEVLQAKIPYILFGHHFHGPRSERQRCPGWVKSQPLK
jgi:hypothetical protein